MKTKKQQVKQKIVAMLVVLFMFVMVFGSINVDFTLGANMTNTAMVQNIIAGVLSMEAPAQLIFNNINLGTAENSKANLTQVNARDYRGNGTPWAVTGTMNNLWATPAGVNNLSNATIAWDPGTVIADNGSTTGFAEGVAGFFDSARTLMNTSTNNGMGNFKVVNTVMNVVYNGRTDVVAGTYNNILQMTIN